MRVNELAVSPPPPPDRGRVPAIVTDPERVLGYMSGVTRGGDRRRSAHRPRRPVSHPVPSRRGRGRRPGRGGRVRRAVRPRVDVRDRPPTTGGVGACEAPGGRTRAGVSPWPTWAWPGRHSADGWPSGIAAPTVADHVRRTLRQARAPGRARAAAREPRGAGEPRARLTRVGEPPRSARGAVKPSTCTT